MTQENYEYVQKGLRIFQPLFAGFICNKLKKQYRDGWWQKVQLTLNDHIDDLPAGGEYERLADSLDLANCIRIVQRMWREYFSVFMDRDTLNLCNELMGIRNAVAHVGQQDISTPDAERYLDTMARLCERIHADGARQIREIYNTVRNSASEASLSGPMSVGGTLVSDVSMRAGVVDDLMKLIHTKKLYKTKMTKKLTFAGKTQVYPICKVRLDALYYNDQNDRIATWISAYKAEHGAGSLSSLGSEEYNDVIESFIYESNPDAIVKTQKNITLVGQREPGVILSDGRVVDGNRRFTCLRRIQRETGEHQFFETVIMDADMNRDRKQIKLLELAVQHGEESKVAYDMIDYAIGTYRDVVVTGLLTAEEYAAGTNETVGEVKKRIAVAELISRFLEYVKLPGQYHIAKDYQVYSLFLELLSMLSKRSEADRERLMKISFHNALLKACPDQRKFIRDIKKLMASAVADRFLTEQDGINARVSEKLKALSPTGKADLDRFAEENKILADDMLASIERCLLSARTQTLANRPAENVGKCKNLLMEIDTRLFSKLDENEKESLRAELDYLVRVAEKIKEKLM